MRNYLVGVHPEPTANLLLKVLGLTLILCVPVATRAEVFLPKLGGSGGGTFNSPCQAGQNLMGFELRAADDVDSVRAVCVTASGPRQISEPHLIGESTPLPGEDGWHGGSGGRFEHVLCPRSSPIVLGLGIEKEGATTIIVNKIHLYCGLAVTGAQNVSAEPSAIYEAPEYERSRSILGEGRVGISGHVEAEKEACPPGQVAVGIHGRSGIWVDAVGLICAVPRLVPDNAIKSIGRVNRGSVPLRAPGSICQSAQEARARNSPVAARLDAACQAFLARPQAPTPAPTMSDALNADDSAVRVQAALDADPMLRQLRDRLAEGEQRGFDLGIASSEGQTLWGPGKQKTYDGLGSSDQRGFRTAVAFVLDRNRNSDLARVGAAITAADMALSEARARDPDPRYWLGFDIATGIFGDPALGAHGNTLPGPGSLGIRDALNPASQRGFNAAMKMLLH
jgi:ribosome modulation factor